MGSDRQAGGRGGAHRMPPPQQSSGRHSDWLWLQLTGRLLGSQLAHKSSFSLTCTMVWVSAMAALEPMCCLLRSGQQHWRGSGRNKGGSGPQKTDSTIGARHVSEMMQWAPQDHWKGSIALLSLYHPILTWGIEARVAPGCCSSCHCCCCCPASCPAAPAPAAAAGVASTSAGAGASVRGRHGSCTISSAVGKRSISSTLSSCMGVRKGPAHSAQQQSAGLSAVDWWALVGPGSRPVPSLKPRSGGGMAQTACWHEAPC